MAEKICAGGSGGCSNLGQGAGGLSGGGACTDTCCGATGEDGEIRIVDAQSHQSRIKQLRAKMDDAGYGALLVMSLVNIRYLTGFTGSAAAVLVTQAETFIISDIRYRLQASREVRAAEFVEVEKTVGQTVARLLGTGDISLAAEANHMNVVEWSRLQSEMGDIQVLRSEGMVESLRARKDEEAVSYSHLRAHETKANLVCRLLLEKKKKKKK